MFSLECRGDYVFICAPNYGGAIPAPSGTLPRRALLTVGHVLSYTLSLITLRSRLGSINIRKSLKCLLGLKASVDRTWRYL